MRGRFTKEPRPALAEARCRWISGGVYSSQAHATIDEEIDRLIHVCVQRSREAPASSSTTSKRPTPRNARADLSDLPQSAARRRRGAGFYALAAPPRRRAAGHSTIVPVPVLAPRKRPSSRAACSTSTGKRLTNEQTRSIVAAPFAERLGALVLCLDELSVTASSIRSKEARRACRLRLDDELVQERPRWTSRERPGAFSEALADVLIALE